MDLISFSLSRAPEWYQPASHAYHYCDLDTAQQIVKGWPLSSAVPTEAHARALGHACPLTVPLDLPRLPIPKFPNHASFLPCGP